MLRVIVGTTVLNLISAFAPQAGRYVQDKEFFALLRKILSEMDDGEKLQIYTDFTGDVGAGVDGFEGGHGAFWFGKRDADGEVMLQLADIVLRKIS